MRILFTVIALTTANHILIIKPSHADLNYHLEESGKDLNAYIWQQGQWFSIPIPYLNVSFESNQEIARITDRAATKEYLAKNSEKTGYTGNGDYDASLIKGDFHAETSFSFVIGSLDPHETSPLYDPNITNTPDDPEDENVAVVKIAWPGNGVSLPPEGVIRVYKTYEEKLGPAKALRQGHLSRIFGSPIPYYPHRKRYYLYEAHLSYEVTLSCAVEVAQPTCHGEARDKASGTYIRIQFPERIIWSDESWLTVVEPAFSLIDSWRIGA